MVLHYGGRADVASPNNVPDGGGVAAVIKEFADMGRYPSAERAGERILGLPIYSGLTEEQQELIIDTIESAIRR